MDPEPLFPVDLVDLFLLVDLEPQFHPADLEALVHLEGQFHLAVLGVQWLLLILELLEGLLCPEFLWVQSRLERL